MRRLTVALWASFGLLLLIGAAQFLLACGFSLGGWLWTYCPAPVDRAGVIAEAEQGERLQRLVHAAEMTLAQKPLCEAVPPARRAETEQTIRKTYERGARGGMLEVFLSWKTLDDLDLLVFCPGGGSIGGRSTTPAAAATARSTWTRTEASPRTSRSRRRSTRSGATRYRRACTGSPPTSTGPPTRRAAARSPSR